MNRASVPKTSLDEDSHACARIDEIGPSLQSVRSNLLPQEARQDEFWPGTRAPVRFHYERNGHR